MAGPVARTLVLDTNFFLIPGRRHVDILSILEAEGYGLILLKSVQKELVKLSEGRSQTATAARIALQLIKQKGLNTVSCSANYTDDAIMDYCRTTGAAAATQDAELRRRLKQARIETIALGTSGKIHVLQTQSTGPHSRTARSVR